MLMDSLPPEPLGKPLASQYHYKIQRKTIWSEEGQGDQLKKKKLK